MRKAAIDFLLLILGKLQAKDIAAARAAMLQHPKPSLKPRPVQYGPGDFSGANADLIRHFDGWDFLASLFDQEANDSDHPQRVCDAENIAHYVRSTKAMIVRFYQQWEIEK